MRQRTTVAISILCGLALPACAGPERVPRQPIKGVDTEENRVDNPHDRDAAPPDDRDARPRSRPGAGGTAAALLGELLDRVAAAHRDEPGIIAVFPALTPTPDSDSLHVNGLGEHLMEETAAALEARGVKSVTSGAGLENDLLAKGKELGALRGLEDVYPLADLIDADYVVFGKVEREVFEPTRRHEVLAVDWICKRTADRETVAAFRQEVTGELADRLYRYYRLGSDWRIGVAAARK